MNEQSPLKLEMDWDCDGDHVFLRASEYLDYTDKNKKIIESLKQQIEKALEFYNAFIQKHDKVIAELLVNQRTEQDKQNEQKLAKIQGLIDYEEKHYSSTYSSLREHIKQILGEK